jgi:hypothetical protein
MITVSRSHELAVDESAKQSRSMNMVLGRQTPVAIFIFVAIAFLSFAFRMYPLARPDIVWALNNPDSIGYLRLADGLRTGCGFAPRLVNGICGPAEVQRTPGYSFFLAISPSLRTVLAIQAVLGAGVCLLVGLFAWHHWGFIAGIIAESITGFDLSSICGNNIGNEVLFTWIIMLAILLELAIVSRTVLDAWSIAGVLTAAFLVGTGALVRPIGVVLLFIVPLGIVPLLAPSLQSKLALSSVALLLSVAMIMGWSYRNYQKRGIWTFSTIGAANLDYTFAAGVLAYGTNRTPDEIISDRLRSVGRESGAPDLWSMTFDEDPREMRSRGLQIVLSHPLVTVIVAAEGFLRSCIMPPNRIFVSTYLGHRVGRTEAQAFLTRNIRLTVRSTFGSRWLVAIRSLLFIQFAVNIFGLIGIGLAVSRIRGISLSGAWLVIIPLLGALLLLLAAAGPGESTRYRVPATPMLALVSAFGWTASKVSKAVEQTKRA